MVPVEGSPDALLPGARTSESPSPSLPLQPPHKRISLLVRRLVKAFRALASFDQYQPKLVENRIESNQSILLIALHMRCISRSALHKVLPGSRNAQLRCAPFKLEVAVAGRRGAAFFPAGWSPSAGRKTPWTRARTRAASRGATTGSLHTACARC